MHRAGEWILWDTGIDDEVAKAAGGKIIAHELRGIVVRTLVEQLSDVGIKASDVRRIILSHGHFDHVGNARLLTHAKWHIQQREHDAMFGEDYAQYGYTPPLYEALKHADVQFMDGDLDLFGDGAVRVIDTQGHTPGHCSLLVKLQRTGPVLLSADVAHYHYNLKRRNVPSMNSDPEASRRSMDRIVTENATLWLNHDAAQTASLKHAPAFYD
ncbi:N-acyl homoserine lactonase family protein [Pseudomonas matsuisoli]|uniref:Metallo-beta-lactamase domain-containing protein n=1 Tax=Pseudomonas matsuisoli TaxID=1515666 RepID=A0A917PQE7_9PSED|nr:N-acyl homoserine lactonase family protein [Pseudomonas matsuisoli]GGJ87254.1 hypothetical protein GCM10009304_11460 [Pseudomonas matsuisoli]